MKDNISTHISLDRIAQILGCESLEKFNESMDFNFYYEVDEVLSKYIGALESISEELFGHHDLSLTKVKGGKNKGLYRVEPHLRWEESANHIRKTINGVGLFQFGDMDEFLKSGPYTAKSAVMHYLGWIASYPDVHDGVKAKYLVERRMR